MKVSERLATLLLGSWLILFSLQNLIHRPIPVLSPYLPALALIAGIFTLLASKLSSADLGVKFLAGWIILFNVKHFLPGSVTPLLIIVHLFGLVAGVLLLVKK